jgi:hypothetical protein
VELYLTPPICLHGVCRENHLFLFYGADSISRFVESNSGINNKEEFKRTWKEVATA